MAQYWLNVAFLRVVIPVTFTACAIWRPVGLSLIYLVLMLISPLISVPTHETMKSTTGRYLKCCLILCSLTALTQLGFHIILLAVPSIHEEFTMNCSFLEQLFRHIGLVRMDEATVWEVFFWLIPEIVALPVTIVVFVLTKKFTWKSPDAEGSNRHPEPGPTAKQSLDANNKIINFLGGIGSYIVLASLCCVSSLNPSVEGGFYFVIFLGAATWWACYKELKKIFAGVCRLLMAVVVLHIAVLLTYQNQWPQEIVPVNSTWSRYFALEPYYMTNCSDPRNVDFPGKDSEWANYGYALGLFWLYYVLALQSQYLFNKPLMRFGSGRTGLLQDSTGSVIVQDGQHDDSIQMQSMSDGKSIPPSLNHQRGQDDEPGPIEHIIMAVYSIFQLIANSSYLATNIIMMTWSIMYHSWTTFVFLLWALILWMVPNKRASMMKCSPFIVLYGSILVLIGYVFSMNLTEEELPTVIDGFSLSELGFSKSDQMNSYHLIVKSAFMMMFWITLRQYMSEKQREQRSSTLRDMVAPLHVTVSAATSSMQHDSTEIKSQFMKDVGLVLKKLFTKFWIVVVAIMLFTSGITGERMTVFRIIYMSLFLIFVISFQISWSGWRKMMYGFWITVIVYSVVMLILVYTYQFHNFPTYWERLYIDKKLQNDIGLETYQTKDLFVRLLTPTFFVIITVLQMHYFHDDFLEATSMDKISVDTVSKRGSLGRSTSMAPEVSPLEVLLSEHEERTTIYTLKQLKHMSKLERAALFRRALEQLKNAYNYLWLFLEIHMQKIIYISLMLLCLNDVCAINLFFVIAVVVVMNFTRSMQIMAINGMAMAVALLMVAKMLYQIEYINHYNWDVNCTSEIPDKENNTSNHTYNSAEWIGLRKAAPGMLPDLLKGYIGIVTVTTFRAIIMVRQCFYRHGKGQSLDTPQVMFPSITRAEADRGIGECLKFLFNYGFYKFGLELCFMVLVALIGTRLDFFSVLYGVWLLIMFAQKRRTIARIWPFFKGFVMILLPLQYFFAVAPPPWLCIDYPWRESQILVRLQEWMYLPDPDFPPNAKKLICDFFLLLMVVRQSLVFRIEARSTAEGQDFVAGHNYSVFQDMEKPNFVNPVKDYVSHIHCWLDVVKRGVMMSFLWITLSIMFLAGTKRTNLFSLGYLIGAFVFLWQGSDFYLRPVKTILKWWNLLLGYNVVVIFSKTILQGVGCVLIQQMEESACWLIQLLGIACLQKFDGSNLPLSATCDVPREDIGMFWDGLCFTFLIIQKRLFKSYYFFHIVDETKAMSILASRGAELLEDLHKKRIEYQENVEKAVLQKLKFKMDKIKADQQRIQGPSYREPADHKIDSLYPRDRPLYKHHTPKTNREAVRSGDYYMFDDFEDEEDVTDLLPSPEDQVEEEERRERQRQRGRRMTVSELMTTLIKTDIEIATHVAMYGGTQKDALRLRRQSVPLTRKKSSMSYLSAHSETETAAASDDGDRTSLVSSEAERELKTDDPDKSPSHSASDERLEGDDNEKEKRGASLLTYFKFVVEFINSSMVSATRYLNRFSRDYRYIRKVLAKEKKILKAKPDFRMGMRLGINQIWQPIPLMKQSSETEGSTDDTTDGDEGSCQSKTEDQSSILTRTQQTPQPEDDQPELSEVDQPPVIQLLASIWFGILAHSTFMCYFMIFLHQIKNASVLSIPLPLMVFFWGSLTIPRPSKTFWVTIIAYTEAIVIVKCIFQLDLMSWNRTAPPNNPLYSPRIIGVEKKPNYALWDLLLLLMVFFHRFMLKSLGQWTTPYVARKIIPSKLTLATMKSSTDTTNQESTRFHWQNEQENQPEGTRQSFRLPHVSEDAPSQDQLDRQNQQNQQSTSTPENPPDPSSEALIAVKGEEAPVCTEKFSTAVTETAQKYLSPAQNFFANILSSDGKEKTNVCAYMFLCDFFNFLLIIFGFSSFGTQQGDGGVAAYVQENRVPMSFLLMLLLQFALIVIDRALFLRKSILGKLVFQYFLIFGVHVWMFFILPSITERQFNDRLPPQIWYMVKCFYLLLAAYQLRLGYPTRILGNFLCKKYSIINYALFKVFMFVPFLFELRAVMDWIWTDTSMTIMDWFKMEDIFASIYQIKCMRGMETDFPQPRGVKKQQMSKYMVGGGALFFIIGLIWFPLLLFALGGTVGVSNLPYEASLSIRIGSYEPIYTMSAQDTSIFSYSEADFKALKNIYSKSRSAVTFLENYEATDVAAVRLSRSSKKLWSISPPDKERLKLELESNATLTFHIEWTVSRKTDVKDSTGVTSTPRNILIPAWINGEFNPLRKNLAELLGPEPPPNGANVSIPVRNVFPKFLKVTNRITAEVPQLMRIPMFPGFDDGEMNNGKDYLYRNATLHLSSANGTTSGQWWVVDENCDDVIYMNLLKQIPLNDCNYTFMFLFNDKAFPEGLSFISGFGILGLYTTAVILVSQIMRRAVSEMAPKIMFDDMPYVDRILRLCLDIYLVRESGELSLEEDLFAKLIFLYRSPETLIRWTRPPESATGPREEGEEEDDEREERDRLRDP
ncbi:piezo-type mechanosensitive ion channel component 1 isoform X3 [Fopius arisanus]|uniref:Piezo-type mechanosensitive ion channel component 1 isoform X3 n=2 Tax=Fopius arisanus TaxID=64838 RepID=A0A9R1TPR1_9HYME|nr:PREDICTED: piezo-type mechanosensitive ion channel component 1 isoform X3 [Fopius arisanus]